MIFYEYMPYCAFLNETFVFSTVYKQITLILKKVHYNIINFKYINIYNIKSKFSLITCIIKLNEIFIKYYIAK